MTYNFSAGPAVLPTPVLMQAQAELPDWHGTGMSVMEMSHRSREFIEIAESAEARLRQLMAVPDDYRVLFLQGGASGQFAAVPMNLAAQDAAADYVITGMWGKRAHAEGAKYLDRANVAAAAIPATYVPPQDDWRLTPSADFVHITLNETIQGVRFPRVPDTGSIPLVSDVSSIILSEPIDVASFGVLYAGAQKNIGPAGLVIIVVREDLLGRAMQGTPTVLDYKVQAEADSMSNTPASYAWYVSGLVFQWLKKQGGLAEMEKKNIAKANLLYDFLDSSGFFKNPVRKSDRSRMNIPFTLADSKLDGDFLKGAEERDMFQLKGHRSVGGMRASIYNAMPVEGVKRLVEYMKEFEAKRT